MLSGGCTCGSIRYEYEDDPILSYKCHCLDCQACSGSGFVTLFWAWKKSYRYTVGEPRFSVTKGSSGKDVSRGFCRGCGNPIDVALGVLPQIVGIVASSLDDPSLFAPKYEVWTSRAQHWDLLDLGLEQVEGNFTGEIIQQHLSGAAGA